MYKPSLTEIKTSILANFDDVLGNLDGMYDPYLYVTGLGGHTQCPMSLPTSTHPDIQSNRDRTALIVDSVLRPLQDLLASYSGEFGAILLKNPTKYTVEWLAAEHSLSETADELQRLHVRTKALMSIHF